MQTTRTPHDSAQQRPFQADRRIKASSDHWGTSAKSNQARFWHGALLFVAIVVLAAAPLFNRTLGQVAVGVLFSLWLLTLFSVKQAAADRSSEAVQANKGKVTSDSP